MPLIRGLSAAFSPERAEVYGPGFKGVVGAFSDPYPIEQAQSTKAFTSQYGGDMEAIRALAQTDPIAAGKAMAILRDKALSAGQPEKRVSRVTAPLADVIQSEENAASSAKLREVLGTGDPSKALFHYMERNPDKIDDAITTLTALREQQAEAPKLAAEATNLQSQARNRDALTVPRSNEIESRAGLNDSVAEKNLTDAENAEKGARGKRIKDLMEAKKTRAEAQRAQREARDPELFHPGRSAKPSSPLDEALGDMSAERGGKSAGAAYPLPPQVPELPTPEPPLEAPAPAPPQLRGTQDPGTEAPNLEALVAQHYQKGGVPTSQLFAAWTAERRGSRDQFLQFLQSLNTPR